MVGYLLDWGLCFDFFEYNKRYQAPVGATRTYGNRLLRVKAKD